MAVRMIRWNNGFDNFNIGMIPTPRDGNCLFHAICNAFYKAYRTENVNGERISRDQIVRKFRSEIAQMLDDTPPTGGGRTNYELLGNGSVKELGDSGVYEYTLGGMKQWLCSSASMGDEIVSFIGDFLGKSIYFLNTRTKDVYAMPTIPSSQLPSIVLLYDGGHFDLASIVESDGSISTHFSPTHPFIVYVRNRLVSLKK